MFGLFKNNGSSSVLPVLTDVHSHLLPGIDDGVSSNEDSIDILREMEALGYKKVITTPHVFWDHYPNTPEIILKKLSELREKMAQSDLSIKVEAAAEYYLDDHFLRKLEKNEKLLSFGDQYLLFETSFINQPSFLIEAVFKISAHGLKPVLAHPERYIYLQENFDLVNELKERQVFFQININSLLGYYSRSSKKLAEKLVDKAYVDFIGSDCHNYRHLEVMKRACQTKYFRKAVKLQLLNNTL